MDKNGNQKGVFVVGMPRSGTTLLSMFLNAHSKISVSFETHYFGRFYRPCERRKCLQSSEGTKNFIRKILKSSIGRDLSLHPEESKQLESMLLKKKPNHADILGAILKIYAHKQQKEIFGEKTPEHFLYLPQIISFFPQAKIIGVVRDPRDVLLSLRDVNWAQGNMLGQVRQWKESVTLVMRWKEKFPDRVSVVLYEDILQNTENELKRLCRFLDVLYEPEMVDYTLRCRPNFNPDQEPWKKKNLEPLDAGNCSKWETEMNPQMVRVIERYANTELKRMQYPIRGEGLRWHDLFFCVYKELENFLLSAVLLAQRGRKRFQNWQRFSMGKRFSSS